MRDFGDKRSTTWNQDPKAANVGLAPGKRTMAEMLPRPVSVPEMPTSASSPVQRKVESSAMVPATPRPRLTALGLFGRVQRKAENAEPDTAAVHASAQRGIATSASPLPHAERIQQLFGRHDISGVKAHTGPEAAASAREIGAQAYATGDNVAFARTPDIHTAAHEAAHVVQQRHGVQLKGGVGEQGDAYEQHADAVADKVMRGESAETLLGDPGVGHSAPTSPPVQQSGDPELAEKKMAKDLSGEKDEDVLLREEEEEYSAPPSGDKEDDVPRSGEKKADGVLPSEGKVAGSAAHKQHRAPAANAIANRRRGAIGGPRARQKKTNTKKKQAEMGLCPIIGKALTSLLREFGTMPPGQYIVPETPAQCQHARIVSAARNAIGRVIELLDSSQRQPLEKCGFIADLGRSSAGYCNEEQSVQLLKLLRQIHPSQADADVDDAYEKALGPVMSDFEIVKREVEEERVAAAREKEKRRAAWANAAHGTDPRKDD